MAGPDLREWVGPRHVRNLAAHGFTLTNRTFESTFAVKRADVEDDRLGLFKPMFAEMGTFARRHPAGTDGGRREDLEGGIVMRNAEGFVTGGATATDCIGVGRAEATVDNSAGLAGAAAIEIRSGGSALPTPRLATPSRSPISASCAASSIIRPSRRPMPHRRARLRASWKASKAAKSGSAWKKL